MQKGSAANRNSKTRSCPRTLDFKPRLAIRLFFLPPYYFAGGFGGSVVVKAALWRCEGVGSNPCEGVGSNPSEGVGSNPTALSPPLDLTSTAPLVSGFPA
ncbi:hypothetical protein [Absidia glauca]|uniref:Ndc10 domain-containing protein n=1 Tax=Absidia glauca TaxID=4829 RepID=A0A163KYB4_ABSGL|nr:hypothetical protein [Absidia glauca]